ncbi:MAG TPA: c-type cytochrome domain-containing protein [Tepidisphaeraceae bacterium]|jgi:mono/diheme cytochrome c family protein
MGVSDRVQLSGFGSAALAGCLGLMAFAGSAQAAEKVDYATQIQPLLKQSCVKCHSLDNPKKQAMAGLRLDDKAGALKGGKHAGKAIVPGKAEDSLVYQLLNGPVTIDGKKIDAMPKNPKRGEAYKPLEKAQITLIKDWIDQGAKFE